MPYKPTGRPNGRPRLHPRKDPMPKAEENATAAAAPDAIKAAPVSVTETPEFKAALEASQKALEARFADMAAEFGKSLQASAARADVPNGVDLTSILSTLALEIGKVSDQGTDRKRVAPEELAARAAAFERMGTLIQAAQALPSKQWPRYKLIAKVNLNDRVIDPIRRGANNEYDQVQILHSGIPNVAMRPVDDSAKAIYREFVRYLGGSESANSVAPSSPVWMTMKGTVLTNASTASARQLGREFSPEPIIVDGEVMPGSKVETVELINQSDPRATEFNVLGTIADSAKVGQVSSRAL